MNQAILFVSQVWFDADTFWSVDTIFTRDPEDRTKWNPAGQTEGAPPGGGSTSLLLNHEQSPSLRGALSFRELLTSVFLRPYSVRGDGAVLHDDLLSNFHL